MAQKTIFGIVLIAAGILFFVFRKQWAKHAEELYKKVAVKPVLEKIAIVIAIIFVVLGIRLVSS
jgi:hypothetical protein